MRANRSLQQGLRLTCTLALLALITAQGHSGAQTLRFLPTAPFNLPPPPDLPAATYGGHLVNFDQVVMDNNCPVGTIQFDYDTYGGVPTGGGFTGGGALAGKFIPAGDARLAPGLQIVWAQTVISTVSGNNVWAAPDNTRFPDTADKTSPIYPFQSLPGGAVAAQPGANFQDFPNRYPIVGNQTWSGELGLLCIDTVNHKANVIETFLWGFGVTAANPGTLANITPNGPAFWGAPTAGFLATERASFNGTGGSTAWTFSTTTSSFLCPEPGNFAMLGAGLFALCGAGLRRRRTLKTKSA